MEGVLEKFEREFESSVRYGFSWDLDVGKGIPGGRSV